MSMTSETLDVETDETESLMEGEPSSSGIDSNDGSSFLSGILLLKYGTTLDLFQATLLTSILLLVNYA